MVAPFKFGNGYNKNFHPTIYNGCNYLSMPGLKLIHVSKMPCFWNSYFSELYKESREASVEAREFSCP